MTSPVRFRSAALSTIALAGADHNDVRRRRGGVARKAQDPMQRGGGIDLLRRVGGGGHRLAP
jgi:hypothetical protein